MSTWVYIKTEPRFWTVGFYSSDGEFHTDSDHDSKEKAAERVSYLKMIADMAERVHIPDSLIAYERGLAKMHKEIWLAGYTAGDQAHSCDDTGCPCYLRGREAEAEELSVSGRQT